MIPRDLSAKKHGLYRGCPVSCVNPTRQEASAQAGKYACRKATIMKKILLLVTVLTVLLVSFTACGSLLDGPVVDVPDVETSADANEPTATEPAVTEPTATEPDGTAPDEPTEPDTQEPETLVSETVSREGTSAETSPTDSTPAETNVVETTPAESIPVETLPVETEPVVTEPTVTEPTVTEPTVTEPSETAPVEAETSESGHTHAWSAWRTVKEATCREGGEKKRTCVCGEFELEALAAVDHDYSIHGDTACAQEWCKLFHSCRFCDLTLLIPLEDRYFYGQLSKEQQENVTAVYNALLRCEEDFIKLPNPMSDAEGASQEITSILYYCCPELVQLSTNEMTRWWRGDDELKLNLIMAEAEYQNACVLLFDFLTQLNGITRDMTDWEKSKFVYDLIIEMTAYEAKTSDAVNPHEGSSLGPLLVGRARCQGYSNAYQLCMWAVGVENYMITGVAGPHNEPHSWNITKLNGSYYWSDVTWDDGEDSPTVYTYFHVSTDEFADHTSDAFWEDWGIPACDKMDMSLFAVKDCYVEAHEDAEAEFLRILDLYYGKDNVLYIRFERTEQFEAILDEATLHRLVQDWVNRHGISLSWGVRYWPDARILYLELSY